MNFENCLSTHDSKTLERKGRIEIGLLWLGRVGFVIFGKEITQALRQEDGKIPESKEKFIMWEIIGKMWSKIVVIVRRLI